MVTISFSPVYAPDWKRLESVDVKEYKLIINGETFDFSPLEKGYELSLEDIGSDLFADKAVMSTDGVLSIALLMPYDEATATDAIRFPEPVTVTADGPVDIPTDHPAPASETPTIEDEHGFLAEQENVH
ncbi:hypothetical protein [Pseudomonas protegens]|uniref:hypothetical protein n=1 Tax=Pseudomonas protegens TaxID=380021 RepID=UPI000F4ABE89|nr:hypothetical protein [Pseudomonas protegens]MDP9504500.1 hypothetical protein [Pseudomonas protegens]ROL86476.1 hypothetical protein BK639_28130 [Pseudomonas protegens]ROL95184.1 hypothetical protein BK640_29305 [Pseudomonas protegens]ROL97824.1 hypothetical protein BK641_26795 [Pseudomonas protegens]ROM07611.1 hypothetical protein BK642_13695 [Pseudomonas protegens]